jgi:ankyrin repeat protein
LLAVEKGHKVVVKVLLEIGKANINLKDSNKQTALLLVVEKGYKVVVKVLLEIGKANINLKDSNK